MSFPVYPVSIVTKLNTVVQDCKTRQNSFLSMSLLITIHLWALLTQTTLPKRKQEMKKKGIPLLEAKVRCVTAVDLQQSIAVQDVLGAPVGEKLKSLR